MVTLTLTEDGNHPTLLSVGDTARLMSYQGEGFYGVKAGGHVYSVEGSRIGLGPNSCGDGDSSCWGRTEGDPGADDRETWWANIRLPDGVAGWTKAIGSFSGMDACG